MASVQTCPDGHKCRNGAVCKQDPDTEGNYYCDCSTITSNTPYAGLSCDYAATARCNPNNQSSFCVNEGVCTKMESNQVVVYGCDCTGTQYTGDRCQFVNDQQIPEGWGPNPVTLTDTGAKSSSNRTAIVASTVSVVLVLLAAMVGVIIWKRNQAQKWNNKSGHDLELEPDGGTMQNLEQPNDPLPNSEVTQAKEETDIL